jgi:hypothetical protein
MLGAAQAAFRPLSARGGGPGVSDRDVIAGGVHAAGSSAGTFNQTQFAARRAGFNTPVCSGVVMWVLKQVKQVSD